MASNKCAKKNSHIGSGRLKIAYLSGPVNAELVYKRWAEGQEQAYFGTSYLSQFYQVCSELGAEGYVVTNLAGQNYDKKRGGFWLENRPMPKGLRGIFYHLGIMFWFVTWIPNLFKFRPNILIVTAFQNYWFCLFFLKLLGIRVIPSVHCVFWPRFEPVRWHWRLLSWLNRYLFWWQVEGAIAVSEDIARELHDLTARPIRTFLPTYLPSQFAGIASPVPGTPFRVFFAGRIERNKGVYDVLAIAKRLDKEQPGKFVFDMCGEGAELESLLSHDLPKNLKVHGVCSPAELLRFLGKSHVVIVPTRTSFEEGYNKVCAEAVLAGRPVITSAVCPALATIREAAIEVTPDAVEEYYDAILRLRDEPDFYFEKQNACGPLQGKFYDLENSWGAALSAILKNVMP